MSSEIFLLLHNIRSLYNVGAIFRTADAAKINKIYLSGYSGTPPRREIGKTALNAEKHVPWEYHLNPFKLLENLKTQGIQIVALEQTPRSVDYRNFISQYPLCLILGHEVLGIDQKLLKLADQIIEIPMYGQKSSLNVSTAFGICVYKLRETW